MPTYEYRCTKCGEHLEVVQSFKDAPLTDLGQALETICSGRRYVDPALASAALTASARKPALTPREAEVLDHLADGLTNEQIASVLVISPRTVDHHVSSLLAKLGAKTRGEAAAHARRLGVDA